MVEHVTTDLLSRNMYALVMMGTPRYLSVFLRSMICSIVVLAATNSEPYVAVSTVACLFKTQSFGVVLTKCNTTVTDFPVTVSWSRLVSVATHSKIYFLKGVTGAQACQQVGQTCEVAKLWSDTTQKMHQI